jgi:hypothetical protein
MGAQQEDSMASSLSVQDMEKRIAEIEREKQLLKELISLHKGTARVTRWTDSIASTRRSNSTSAKVVDATIELNKKMGRPVTNEEVLRFIEQTGLKLGNSKDKIRLVGSILSQECKRATSRLNRLSRGMYEGKQ